MKLILENWKKYLKEYEDDEDEYIEQGLAFGKLGKHVFPKDMSPRDPEKEKELNTKLEKMLRDALSDHFVGSDLEKDPIDAIQDLIDEDLYPEVFRRYTRDEETGETEVYRGIYVSRAWMRETFGDDPEFEKSYKESDPMVEIEHSTKISLSKGRLASSWTTSMDRAMEFSKSPSHFHRSGISLVLVADASDKQNYFIDLEPFYDYKFGNAFAFEEEVLGVGDTIIKKAMWKEPA